MDIVAYQKAREIKQRIEYLEALFSTNAERIIGIIPNVLSEETLGKIDELISNDLKKQISDLREEFNNL